MQVRTYLVGAILVMLCSIVPALPAQAQSLDCSHKAAAVEAQKDKMLEEDMSDPSRRQEEEAYLDYLRLSYNMCLEAQASTCQAGYVKKNGQCMTPDAGCKATYGSYSVFQSYDAATGYPVCGCASGYEWNTAGTSCVAKPQSTTNTIIIVPSAPQKTIDQQCKASYGSKSYGYDGSCYCVTGHMWSSDRKSCVPSDIISSETITVSVVGGGSGNSGSGGTVSTGSGSAASGTNACTTGTVYLPEKNACVTNAQFCKLRFREHSHWNGNFEPGYHWPSCDCDAGYPWDAKKADCVAPQKAAAQAPQPASQAASLGVLTNWTVHHPEATSSAAATTTATSSKPEMRKIWKLLLKLFEFLL